VTYKIPASNGGDFFFSRCTFAIDNGHLSSYKIVLLLAHVLAWVAQLVEQRTENPRVGGSIPSPGTI
jgi:hypothetical protein